MSRLVSPPGAHVYNKRVKKQKQETLVRFMNMYVSCALNAYNHDLQ